MFIELLLTSPESRQLQLLNVIRTQRRIEFTEIAKILQWPYVSTQQVRVDPAGLSPAAKELSVNDRQANFQTGPG
ncbi:hypothetical protein [Lentilactobacillus parafarraginis]|uniref:Uncharacterized protein n=1 Tax=Lentilactobacillus parafarraginis DSM 18390 = JCM 14109 TaxID=1423786 RepID=A0A0R1YZ19_9LACO|nr:hypothetical protein [Lentilactobacillus parafarraginis]KRM44092.1 hypothetical protein FD47_GL000965 [Lentilactobacillus parafarraginis DSM 18390 = JCM 14109]